MESQGSAGHSSRCADAPRAPWQALIGGAAIDATGSPYPKETEEKCKASDAVLLAAIGG